MKISELFGVILTNAVLTSFILAILGYLSRSILERWISRNLEKYKVNLQLAAFEHQTRFTRLHEKRADIIAELYKKLVEVEHLYKVIVVDLHRSHLTPPTEKTMDKISNLLQKETVGFMNYFRSNRIYFSKELSETIEQFYDVLSKTSGDIYKHSVQYQGKEADWIGNAVKKIANDIPQLLQQIESEFREILEGARG